MMRKKAIIAAVIIWACMCSACTSQPQDAKTNQSTEDKSSYLTSTFAPELYDVLFEKELCKYEVNYSADYYFTMIEGQQDLIYYENFFVYEKDTTGKVINCKTVMITKPELNQTYMEEYLAVVCGADYKYEKPFKNVYVHVEDMSY